MGPWTIQIFLLGFFSYAQADSFDLKTFLESFHRDPKQVMSQQPQKWDEQGNPVHQTWFSVEQIKKGEDLQARTQMREQRCMMRGGTRHCLKDTRPGRSAFGAEDKIEVLLVDSPEIIRSLSLMEQRRLQKSQLDKLPWSDSYWPMAKGLIGNRYNDPKYPRSKDWTDNRDYTLKRPASEILSAGDQRSIDNLAPSEKYDFIVGETGAGLTGAVWNLLPEYLKKSGNKTIETWMGICHGWAPASIAYDEPIKPVAVPGLNGGSITFYPSDIKALASMLWAKVDPAITPFIGGICKVKNPAVDEVGHIIESDDCFDPNPGIWHMAVVNQIGVARRGMVMDATYDSEIWNHPIFGYEYSFFNPQTLVPTARWRAAVVSTEDYSVDKFKKYRSPETRFVVGVLMKVHYMVEVQPSHSTGHTTNPRTVDYVYDLEIDGNGNIVGGEWYTNKHPDFLWVIKNGQTALSAGDNGLTGDWVPGTPLPLDWAERARSTSGGAVPLQAIVQKLVNMSAQ